MPPFKIFPLERFKGIKTSIKRPQAFACFSHDGERGLHTLSYSSLKYYYPPFFKIPWVEHPAIDLCRGFDTFDEYVQGDEHLNSLLTTLVAHEQQQGKAVTTDIVTWRGIMTKVSIRCCALFDGSNIRG